MQKYASHCTLHTGNPDCAQPWYGEEFLQADRRKSHVQLASWIVLEASWKRLGIQDIAADAQPSPFADV